MLPQKRDFWSISTDDENHDLDLAASQFQASSFRLDGVDIIDPISSQQSALAWSVSILLFWIYIHKTEVKILEKHLPNSVITSAATKKNDNTNLHFRLVKEDDAFFLSYGPGKLVASLNKSTSEVLQKISTEPSIEFDVYISRSLWSKIFQAPRILEKDLVISADINIYGDMSISGAVGRALSTSYSYLQRPIYLESEKVYQNPQCVRFPGIEPQKETRERVTASLEGLIDPTNEMGNVKDNLKNEFAVVFGSLIRSHCLIELDADKRIKTQLLAHQKEALDFIAQREFGPVPTRFSLWKNVARTVDETLCFEHLISGTRSNDKHSETGGGILADDMGLGKTLTILATIVSTINAAANFQSEIILSNTADLSIDMPQYRSRATLVVVPSHMLIKSWTEEVTKHVYGGLKVCEYHGRGRESKPDAIATCDIVLSTYHTIASESSKSTSPLFQINWFRVVLDEAHTIRTSSTQLFQAVTKLSAKLRWCVTGTPVQNGLEDLGSLVAFLKVPMLDTPPEFKRHIIDPLVRVNGSGSSNLRVLLDSICLRRLNKLLDLPDVDQIWQNIQFSDVEREQYDAAEAQMSNEIKLQVNLQRSSSSYFSILELEMRLRRLCNHGTFELPLSKMAYVQEPFKETSSITCDSCQTDLSSNILMNNLCNGHHTSCGHLICSGCLVRFEEALVIAKDSESRICPLCGKQLGGDYLLLDGPEVIPGENSKESTAYFQPGGVSTKINALLANIEKSNATDKSIIFSGWTKTLDLIEHHLTERNILFRRIDGSSSLPLRSKILNEFRKNSQIRILMMTTGTGAVGLNLAVASCVHIFEPQWNPMVESQAVARVVRLGQKKKVSIIRYIVEGTVEQTMRSQQQRKLALADVGWSKHGGRRGIV